MIDMTFWTATHSFLTKQDRDFLQTVYLDGGRDQRGAGMNKLPSMIDEGVPERSHVLK
jgi:hypothetical protein